tara:strand:- start:286 stop:1044 length:759 start_codon:yes stop_codon:yes gene_type:complete
MSCYNKKFTTKEVKEYENVKSILFTKFKLNTANNIYLILNKINKHKHSLGNYVECGTFKGSTLLSVAQFCKQNDINTKLVGVDTFGGFPNKNSHNPLDLPEYFKTLFKNQKITESHFNKAKLRTNNFTNISHLESEYFLNIEEVFTNCSKYKNIELIKGTFEDVTPTYSEPISILHLDGDLYSGYLTCLNNLYDNVIPGGCIIFDEYYSHKYPGARVAVDEFFLGKESEGHFEKYITPEGHERWCFEKLTNN